MNGEEPRVRLDVDGELATVTLTGRDGSNAMDLAFVRELDELTAVVAELALGRRLKVLVLRAEGRHFCVGGDLAEFEAAEDLGGHLLAMTEHAHRAIARLHALTVPVVVAVRGATAGAGLGLVLTGDVVVAEASAVFVGAYAAAGLSPDAGVSWALPRVVGPTRATDFVLTNRRVGAPEMESWGLVTRVVADGGLDTAVADVCATILDVPLGALLENKRLLGSRSTSLTGHLDDEAQSIARLATRP